MSDVSVRLPAPHPAVISLSNRGRRDAAGYDAAAARMLDLAAPRPGLVGAGSARGVDDVGITVACAAGEDAIAQWRPRAGRVQTRPAGGERRYNHFELRVARTGRAYRSCGAAS